MGAPRVLNRKLIHHFLCSPQPHFIASQFSSFHRNFSPSSFCYVSSDNSSYFCHSWRYRSCRTLILESESSESVRICKLSSPDSGIIEVCLDRPEAKNAIGKDTLTGLRHTLEAIEDDSSTNVLLLCSSVPKEFCTGADLKERKTMNTGEVHFFVNDLRSTFSMLEELQIRTISVIEGVALGGGLEIALSCDLRICGLSYFVLRLGCLRRWGGLHIMWNIGGILTTFACIGSIFWLMATPPYEELKRTGILMGVALFEGASVGPLIELAIEVDPR